MNQTTTAEATMAAPLLNVTLADGEEQANVLAKLLKKHIEDLVAGEPSKADVARRIRGKLGLNSTEPEALVTLVFKNEGIEVRNGIDADNDGVITGPLKLQTETLVGVVNPYTAMLKRQLKVGIKWSRPLFTLQAYGFLKVPPHLRPPKPA
jgi:hypothetical protein